LETGGTSLAAASWIRGEGAKLRNPELAKVLKVAAAVTLLGLGICLLTGCGGISEEPTIVAPATTEALAQVPSTAAQPTQPPTAVATETPVATEVPVATETPTPVIRASSLLDEVAWVEVIEAELMGVRVKVRIVTGETLTRGDWFAIEKVVLNKDAYPDAERRVAELVMRAHWHAWMNDDLENREDVTFEDYMARVAGHEDMSYQILATVPEESVSERRQVRIDPRSPVEIILSERSGYVKYGNHNTPEEVSFSFAVDRGGELYVLCRVFRPRKSDYERYKAEDEQRNENYYTSYHYSGPPVLGLAILSLSEAFQARGYVDSASFQEVQRLTACGYQGQTEFLDMDLLVASCADGAEGNTFEGVLKAIRK